MEKTLIFRPVNPDGAMGKWGTIKKAIIDTGASVWMMQETKCKVEGKLKLDGFITYEHLRSKGDRGGLALCARTEVNPAFVRDGGEEVEALTVDLHVSNLAISCTTAYGPQENACIEKKTKFWNFLTEEAVRANKEGMGFVLQGDLNCWLGKRIIPGDTREQNKNGKLFENFLTYNRLTVVNSLPLCQGVTTRARMRNGAMVESVLDFYVVCQRVLTNVTDMIIDVDRNHRVTNFRNVKKSGKTVDTDHLTTVLKINLNIIHEKPVKIEMLNFKDKTGQIKFKENTTKTNDLSNCLLSNKPVKEQALDWMNVLVAQCNKSFPKIRIGIKNLNKSKASILIDKRNLLSQDRT